MIDNFYNYDTKEFDSTADLELTNGNVALLQNANIIAQVSNLTYTPTIFAFCIQPNVRIYLNNAVKEGKILITKKDFEWKL